MDYKGENQSITIQRKLSIPLIKLLITFTGGTLATGCIFLLFAINANKVMAAPSAAPLLTIFTGTTFIAHTSATTHQMRVFGDGRISDQFLNNDNQNQIDQNGNDPRGTTIAVLFDQHSVTPTSVDVGAQGDFTQTTSITLDTASIIPGYDEDSRVVYASQVLPYQIVQQTLAKASNNCVIIELDIQHTGGISLTGGRLLFMMDIDTALNSVGDIGIFDAQRNLVYLTDFNNSGEGGYAMGVSLVEGAFGGYGINGDAYPETDAEIINEIISPSNTIIDGNNDVVWLVANIPDLASGQSSELVFSVCATTGPTEEDADDKLNDTYEEIVNLTALKTSTPPSGEAISAGQSINYTITLSNSGDFPLQNLVLTDTLPVSTSLVAYSISEGNLIENNGMITATLDQLNPTSPPVTINLSIATSSSLASGTVLTNQAFIESDQLIKRTNIVTHIVQSPDLSVIKSVTPEIVEPGGILSYTIVTINNGQVDATGVTLFDPLPNNTQFRSGSVSITPPSAGGTSGSPPSIVEDMTVAAGESVTVTYAVQVDDGVPSGTIIFNTASVTSAETLVPVTDTVTSTVFIPYPALLMTKSGPQTAQIGSSIVYTFTVVNIGNTPLDSLVLEDGLVASTVLIEDGNGDAILDIGEVWIYTANYTLPLLPPATITNTATISASYLDTIVTARDSHVVDIIGFEPVLSLTKVGPSSARVGDKVSFTFTLGHAPTSDQTPVKNIVVTDDYAGTATRISGDNGDNILEFGENWVYTADYVIKPNSPNPLINTGTATGLDTEGNLITATATHQTDISEYNPVLFVAKDGPAAIGLGKTAVYTFTLLNFVNISQLKALQLDLDMSLLAAITPGDGSPLSVVSVFDNVVGNATYLRGDGNNNGKIDGGEAWIYTASKVISSATSDPLMNTVTVTVTDPENNTITGTAKHSTDIIHEPKIKIEITGPSTASVGEQILLDIKVSHAEDSDGSPLDSLVVNSSVSGPIARASISSGNTNNILESGEVWEYNSTHTVKINDPQVMVDVITVAAQDTDLQTISASSSHSVTLFGTVIPYYFPLLKKNN
ncbi:MAG: DUF11 domain-containing protein [Anaerolineae bacterium]|nr:DUF11 domain-containing protein [Anaerolineae bacterium]